MISAPHRTNCLNTTANEISVSLPKPKRYFSLILWCMRKLICFAKWNKFLSPCYPLTSGYPQLAAGPKESSNQSPSGAAWRPWTTVSTTAWPTAPLSNPPVQLPHTCLYLTPAFSFFSVIFSVSPIFIVCFKFECTFYFCYPLQISRSTTQSMGKVGIPL